MSERIKVQLQSSTEDFINFMKANERASLKIKPEDYYVKLELMCALDCRKMWITVLYLPFALLKLFQIKRIFSKKKRSFVFVFKAFPINQVLTLSLKVESKHDSIPRDSTSILFLSSEKNLKKHSKDIFVLNPKKKEEKRKFLSQTQ